ncbi:hypothetical protein SO694_000372137 [Aureococcus anophagefferens]|uniref:MoxR domain-containing protein n=1 Tax=Aureococcus anophagefferens TaxID=44056 RepID=A0ABR1FL48_AURAN
MWPSESISKFGRDAPNQPLISTQAPSERLLLCDGSPLFRARYGDRALRSAAPLGLDDGARVSPRALAGGAAGRRGRFVARVDTSYSMTGAREGLAKAVALAARARRATSGAPATPGRRRGRAARVPRGARGPRGGRGAPRAGPRGAVRGGAARVARAPAGREHVLFVGPPGVAKSLLCRRLGELFGGPSFEIALTRFTTPDDVFGPTGRAAGPLGVGVRRASPAANTPGGDDDDDDDDALYDRFLIRREVAPVSDAAVADLLLGDDVDGRARALAAGRAAALALRGPARAPWRGRELPDDDDEFAAAPRAAPAPAPGDDDDFDLTMSKKKAKKELTAAEFRRWTAARADLRG